MSIVAIVRSILIKNKTCYICQSCYSNVWHKSNEKRLFFPFINEKQFEKKHVHAFAFATFILTTVVHVILIVVNMLVTSNIHISGLSVYDLKHIPPLSLVRHSLATLFTQI